MKIRDDEGTQKLSELRKIDWTIEEESVLNKVFTGIDTMLYHFEQTNQKDKMFAIWKARWELHEIVTAIGLNKIIKDMVENERN